MAKLVKMRGLQNFVSEIRACKNPEDEQVRVDKELAKIRKKFASNSNLTDYDRKKYVWKLLYIYMLGYEVDFGHKQACDLIPANKYAEKQVGYMAASVMLSEKDEFLRLVTNSIRNDLISRNEAFQCLALAFIANVGGQEMAQLLSTDVMNLLMNGAVRPVVRKKAALTLLRMMRKAPSDPAMLTAETWAPNISTLLEERDLGVLLAVVSLLLGCVSRNYEGYERCVPQIVRILDKLKNKDVSPDYTYYGIPSPWLQVKCIRVLQYFPPPEDPALVKALTGILRHIISGTEVAKNVNKNNAQHAIVFEAIALALALEADDDLLNQSVAMLGKFISVREPNIRYLGLENMVRLAEVPAVVDAVQRHQKSILNSLSDPDISIRKRALDLLFTMCSAADAREIVGELLNYLNVADFAMREELVLKTAVLAEKYFPDLFWYVDTMLTLIERGGEYAIRDIWHSLVQLITNHPELHEYAARKAVEGLRRGAAHETYACAASYILGEYGHLLSDVPAKDQFNLLYDLFLPASTETKAIMLSSFLKLELAGAADPALVARIRDVFARYSQFMDAELQQRAVEYSGLSGDMDVARRHVAPMPKWEKRKSILLRRLAEKEGAVPDGEGAQGPAWFEDNGFAAVVGAVEPLPQLPAAPQPQVDLLGGLDDVGTAPAPPYANGSAAPAPPFVPAAKGTIDLMELLSLSVTETAPAAPAVAVPSPSGAADPFALSAPAPSAASVPAPVPAPPPQPAVSTSAFAAPGAVDLFSSAASTSSAPSATTSADPFGLSPDPFGGSAFGMPSAGSAPPVVDLPPIEPIGELDQWYKNLLLANSGVWYEDLYLQLGLKGQLQGGLLRLQLFFGNKSATTALNNFSFTVPPDPLFHFQMGPVPSLLEPNKQIQAALLIAPTAAFVNSPTCQLSYTHGQQRCSQTLQLPVLVSKFCTAPEITITREQFFSRWQAIPAPPQKVSEFFTVATPAARHEVDRALSSLQLGLQQGIDPDPENWVAAATFAANTHMPTPTMVPCMVRLEVEKTQRLQFRVTVATLDGALTAALKDLIVAQIAKE